MILKNHQSKLFVWPIVLWLDKITVNDAGIKLDKMNWICSINSTFLKWKTCSSWNCEFHLCWVFFSGIQLFSMNYRIVWWLRTTKCVLKFNDVYSIKRINKSVTKTISIPGTYRFVEHSQFTEFTQKTFIQIYIIKTFAVLYKSSAQCATVPEIIVWTIILLICQLYYPHFETIETVECVQPVLAGSHVYDVNWLLGMVFQLVHHAYAEQLSKVVRTKRSVSIAQSSSSVFRTGIRSYM